MSEKVSAGHEAHGIDAMQGGAMLFDLVHAVADHASRPTDETAVRRMVGRAMRSTRVYRSGRYKTLLYKDLNYLNGMAMVLRERIELSTSPLPMECSTTELPQQALRRVWAALGFLCHRRNRSASRDCGGVRPTVP